MVVARGEESGGDIDQRVQRSSYKMNKFRGASIQHGVVSSFHSRQ